MVYHIHVRQSRWAEVLFSSEAKNFFGKFAKGLDNPPPDLYNIKVLDGRLSASLVYLDTFARVAELADAHV